jgi:hypothetical protein
LVLRLRRWIELCRHVGASRFLLDGSFVTAKQDPDDIDAVVLLPRNFQAQVDRGDELAMELEEMLLTRRPEEIFAAEDESDWNACRVLLPHARGGRTTQRTRGGSTMISNATEYRKAQEEITSLEQRLKSLLQTNPDGSKGFTKAGIRKIIARLHEELAVYEGTLNAQQPASK